MTLRAIRTLREVSLILAEDTRHTRKLLTHFQIDTRLLSYHQHNKVTRLDRVLSDLAESDVALVSDSGTPSISDPGFELIAAAIAADVPVDVLPGANAAITAVVAAAIPAPGFLFVGFLPRRTSERRARLRRLASLEYTLVLYEAPHRLLATLHDLNTELGDRQIVAGRELTKRYQELVRGTVSQLIAHFSESEPRGEFTLVVAGTAEEDADRRDEARAALRARYQAGESRGTAVAEVAAEFGVSRNDAYRLWLEVRSEGG